MHPDSYLVEELNATIEESEAATTTTGKKNMEITVKQVKRQ